VIPVMLSRGYFEWYEMFVLGTHSVLMFFPSIFWLNFVYLFWIFMFNIKLFFPYTPFIYRLGHLMIEKEIGSLANSSHFYSSALW
jgi:hypothetical protein